MKGNWENHWKDYYQILQVHPSAKPEVVKAAYDKLARILT
jgi:DnaJ-class molecular chaperone